VHFRVGAAPIEFAARMEDSLLFLIQADEVHLIRKIKKPQAIAPGVFEK